MNIPTPIRFTAATFFMAATFVWPVAAQDPDPPDPNPRGEQRQSDEPRQGSTGWRKFGEASAEATPRAIPAPQLTLPAGTWITVRVNQPLSRNSRKTEPARAAPSREFLCSLAAPSVPFALSSDQNRQGDVFSATLSEPVIADGFVVARRGQTVAGRVVEAQKAGRVKGTSHLAVELTELSLVDGQQLPVVTQLVEYSAGTSVGRDATVVGTATGVGAAIGAAANGGVGAGAGAAAGAVASMAGVLLTRGRATVVYPEAALTFRTSAPLTIFTERSAHAFLQVRQEDYEQRLQQRRTGFVQRPTLYAPYPYYYSSWGYDPWFYGPGFGYGYWGGPRISFYGRGFYGGGFRGGRRR